VGRAEAYRLGIQAIRDGLGEDGFLLGDGSVPCTRNTLHTALSRWYQPDPDVMIARREFSLLGLLDVIGGLRASSDPVGMLAEAGLTLLRESLTVSTPDRPITLTHSHGGAVTHFTRGTFNLLDEEQAGVRAYSYAPTPA